MTTQAEKINATLTEIATCFFDMGVQIMDLFVKDGENAADVWGTALKIPRGVWIYRSNKENAIEDLIHFFKNSSKGEIKDAWNALLKLEQEQYILYTHNPRLKELKEALDYIQYGVEEIDEALTDEELEEIEEME